jgi:hypothetical protein
VFSFRYTISSNTTVDRYGPTQQDQDIVIIILPKNESGKKIQVNSRAGLLIDPRYLLSLLVTKNEQQAI